MAPRSALSPLVPSRLSCPLPSGGEGSMLCPRIRMGEGAFLQTPPHPSFSADASSRPLPQRGEGTITTAARAASAHRAGRWRTFISRCQTAHVSSFPRRVLAPWLSLFFHTRPEIEGRAERREAHSLRCRAGEARRASGGTRSPRGAPPWRFRPVSALPAPALPPDPVSERPRSQKCLAGKVPDLPSPRLRAAAAGRHSPLRLQDRL